MLQGLTLSPSASKEIAQELAIETRELSKSYGDIKAVAGLNLAIPEGQFFGLLGRNGSGKTTTLHMLSTLIQPTQGGAQVAGYDVVRSPVEVHRAIGSGSGNDIGPQVDADAQTLYSSASRRSRGKIE